jgi:L-ascorbate metabolism protein UlaG (beta-lactamase superfamily)
MVHSVVKRYIIPMLIVITITMGVSAMEGATSFASDSFVTPSGKLEIVFIGHATLAMQLGNFKIHVDPQTRYTDYSRWEKADLILITHEHGDHLDMNAIKALSGPQTLVITTQAVRNKLGLGEVLEHGPVRMEGPFAITAVPAYNVTPGRTGYHPRERKDNGYVVSAGSFRIYIAGDTEPIPEMANLGPLDVAFLPMNQPYTMTPEQVAEAVRVIRPKIVYPYHYSSTNPRDLEKLLEKDTYTEVRIRKF